MAEYIKREAVLEKNHGGVVYVDDIEKIPPADVVPVRHGRWKPFGRNLGECSECGEVVAVRNNYCPNCGAKMDGERKGEANES